MNLDPERRARIVLNLVSEPGQPSVTRSVAGRGATEVLDLLETEARSSRGVGADLAARLAEADPEAALQRAHDLGIRFVCPLDAEWPAQLDELGLSADLHERGGAPVGLWVRGRPLDEVVADAVAVVGSRSATTYGADAAGMLGAGIAKENWTVVSGAAFGIDHAAHRGALAVRGTTVAVLASGPDRPYPTAHRDLIDHLAEVGAVISEAPPGSAPTRIRFLARNRLIAALCRGTVVVEAAMRSGALNTASWTLGLGRAVMGVPGPITSAPSAGVHQLIRHRDATLVTDPQEVLEVVGPVGTLALAEPREAVRPRDRLSHTERQVLDAVPVRHASGTARIGRTAGVSTDRTRQALRTLLSVGLVEHDGGRWRLRPE